MSLTAKQARFVDEYLIDLNATQAAIRAGYSEKTAYSQGQRLLKVVEVATAIEDAKVARAADTGVNAAWIVERLVEVAERCLQHRQMLDRSGKPVMVETADGVEATAYVFDARGAVAAMALLSKHTGGFVERQELSGPGGQSIPTRLEIEFVSAKDLKA